MIEVRQDQQKAEAWRSTLPLRMTCSAALFHFYTQIHSLAVA